MRFVDDGISQVECARAEAEPGDDLGGGVEGGPDPDLLAGLTDMGPELIQRQKGQSAPAGVLQQRAGRTVPYGLGRYPVLKSNFAIARAGDARPVWVSGRE